MYLRGSFAFAPLRDIGIYPCREESGHSKPDHTTLDQRNGATPSLSDFKPLGVRFDEGFGSGKSNAGGDNGHNGNPTFEFTHLIGAP